MLDGIDYYPSKKKRKPRVKNWVLMLGFFILGVYGYQYLESPAEKSSATNTLIVISKGKKQAEEKVNSVIIKSNNIDQVEADRRVKSDKGLDELIQTFKQQ
jgi:D-arabinose 1-dehydrogenase-like Zn-dependent alcohol dehydrogenase